MNNIASETIATYDESAEELAKYFQGIGSRVEDIKLGFKLVGNPEPARVVEIGCGDGRDAAEIVRRTVWYQGFDPSVGMLELAKKKVPKGSFVQAEATSYKYPDNLDIVFSFASLLHSPKEDIAETCGKVLAALRPGGVFYISLKEKDEYSMDIKEDRFGRRLFYFYNIQLIRKLAGSGFESVHEAQQIIGDTKWFTIALRKREELS